MGEARTFKVGWPPMEGSDVKAWQDTLNRQMVTWNVNLQLEEDGVYGVATRALTASVAHGLGLDDAGAAMENGLTPELRVKLRNKDLTPAELDRFHSPELAAWRAAFADRYDHLDVNSPLSVILQSSNGWTGPAGHDGVDLICKASAPLLAICTGKIVRVSASGWWGKNPTPSPGHPVSDGDGIIILQCAITDGPFRPGLNFGYGHAEHARVEVGDTVQAGEAIGLAGFARAWHTHFMVNNDAPVDNGFYRGVGDRDPMPYVNYARRA